MSEGFKGNKPEKVSDKDGEWWYEKVNGKWQHVLLPRITLFSREEPGEGMRRAETMHQMLTETRDQWKMEDPNIEHNYGILRNHPRYHDLFEKWAIRYLRMEGRIPSEFSGRIHPDEGRLYDSEGKLTNQWLINVVANGREWIDENAEMELRISEGFIDLTHHDDTCAELGISPEPEYEGWWTEDEI